MQEHKYLGALLSYNNFELTNLRHRLSVMRGAYWRLQHILRSGALGLSMRTAIWRICVFSVLRYSLCHVGIPTGGHNLIRQAVHRQLRLIAKSPAHLWHVTSAQILERLHVEDPWATLCREAQTRSPRPALASPAPGCAFQTGHSSESVSASCASACAWGCLYDYTCCSQFEK